MKLPPRLFLTCLILAASPLRATADDQATLAQGYCYEMQNLINVLVDFTETKCIPGGGDVGMSFIFVSSEPVFSVPAAKKAWLTSVVGMFGKTFNTNSMESDQVIFTDTILLTRREAYWMPAPKAKQLQHQVKNNQIDIETMYQRISESLQELAIPD